MLDAASCGVTRRKLQTPGTAEDHKRQETPTTNPIDRQPTHLTNQAPSTIERAARETHNTPRVVHSARSCMLQKVHGRTSWVALISITTLRHFKRICRRHRLQMVLPSFMSIWIGNADPARDKPTFRSRKVCEITIGLRTTFYYLCFQNSSMYLSMFLFRLVPDQRRFLDQRSTEPACTQAADKTCII